MIERFIIGVYTLLGSAALVSVGLNIERGQPTKVWVGLGLAALSVLAVWSGRWLLRR